ncbi:MAG: hypothetical protein GY754_40815 [bacterium]|nr:hypothetical protein [bacterium]
MEVTDKLQEVEERLRVILLPVFGLDTVDEVLPGHSFVGDIGADSIDFVEIIYLVEQHFGVILKINEIFVGGVALDPDEMFIDGELTEENAETLKKSFPESGHLIAAGMSKMDFFTLLTVRDLSKIIEAKMPEDFVMPDLPEGSDELEGIE